MKKTEYREIKKNKGILSKGKTVEKAEKSYWDAHKWKIIAISCFALVFYFSVVQLVWRYLWKESAEHGTLGDTFGGLTSPVINLVSAILVYIAFMEQKRANDQMQKQIDKEVIHRNYQEIKEELKDLKVFIKGFEIVGHDSYTDQEFLLMSLNAHIINIKGKLYLTEYSDKILVLESSDLQSVHDHCSRLFWVPKLMTELTLGEQEKRQLRQAYFFVLHQNNFAKMWSAIHSIVEPLNKLRPEIVDLIISKPETIDLTELRKFEIVSEIESMLESAARALADPLDFLSLIDKFEVNTKTTG